jgi:hypothetical protein
MKYIYIDKFIVRLTLQWKESNIEKQSKTIKGTTGLNTSTTG